MGFSGKQYQNWVQNTEFNSYGHMWVDIEIESMTKSIFRKNPCQWVQSRQHKWMRCPWCIKSARSTKKKVRLNVAFICLYYFLFSFSHFSVVFYNSNIFVSIVFLFFFFCISGSIFGIFIKKKTNRTSLFSFLSRVWNESILVVFPYLAV